MKAIIFCFFLAIVTLQTGAYVTPDGKTVPGLPIPAGATVYVCSTFQSLYLNMRNHMVPNTCFLIKDGTYAFGSITVSISADHVYFIGESGDPSKVVLTGSGFDFTSSPRLDMFHIESGAHHIIFANITLAEVEQYAIKFNGLTNMGNILWHNVRFANIGVRGIKGVGNMEAPACTTRYCQFENTKVPLASRPDGFGGDYIAGMDIMSAAGWAIHDSFFKNILGANGGGRAGVFMWVGCSDVWTMRNTFINCDRSIAYGNYSSSSVSHSNSVIMNNFIVAGASNEIELYYTVNLRCFNNTLTGPGTNTASLVYQNASDGGSNQGAQIKNNIVYGSISNQNSTPPDTANNIILTRSQSSLVTRWFVNNDAGDLHLTADTCSPVDRGTALSIVTDDWGGSARSGTLDIGADEFGNPNSIQFIPEEITIIKDAYLSPASPNPFNPVTCVRYGIADKEAGKLYEVTVLSPEGRTIRTLRKGSAFPGSYAIQWDAKDDKGVQVASGSYVMRLSVGSNSRTTRVVFMK